MCETVSFLFLSNALVLTKDLFLSSFLFQPKNKGQYLNTLYGLTYVIITTAFCGYYFIIFILKVVKLRYREDKSFGECHAASKW